MPEKGKISDIHFVVLAFNFLNIDPNICGVNTNTNEKMNKCINYINHAACATGEITKKLGNADV